MQHRDALGKAKRGIHVVLDHDDGDVARNGVEQRANRLTLAPEKPGERMRREAAVRLLRERHGKLEPAPLAIGGLDDDPLRALA